MNSEVEVTIKDLGYDAFFETYRKRLKLGEFSVARVISEHKEAYRVKNPNGEYLAKITGRQRFNASSREDYPAVGDWVAITELEAGRALINAILPRKTTIRKKTRGKNEIQIIATNIDVAFVVESVDRDFSLNRFERYFAIVSGGGVRPAIVLNKVDLVTKKDLDTKLIQIKGRFAGVDCILTSTVSGRGLGELKKYIKQGKTYCFLGSSGVGKSSLINKLLGEGAIKTGGVSLYSGRGKHVTTSREMYVLKSGGIVVDNPGIREVGIADAGAGVDDSFGEITGLAKKCKYNDCTHTHEPGCQVLATLSAGKLGEEQYSNYLNLKSEAKYGEMTKYEKRKKDRQFGKFLKKAKDELKRYGY